MPRKTERVPKGKLVQRSAGVWYIEWWDSDLRQPRRVSCRTQDRSEAEDALAEFRAALLTPEIPEQPTIRTILDGYEAEKVAAGASVSMTYACNNLRKHLGGLRPADLSKEVIANYYATRRADGRPDKGGGRRTVSDGTLIKEAVLLRAGLRWAIGQKWLPASDEPKITVPEKPQPKERWLSHAEYDSLLAGADAFHIQVYIVLALATAGRRGAILELRWDAISDVVDLGRGRGNKRRAIVPLTERAREILEKARELATTEWVIEWRGERVKNIKTGFNRACQRAGLRDVTPHVLRHTAASWMTQAGVPLSEVARFLGDSEQMVEKVYAKHRPDYLRNAAAALDFRPDRVA